MILTSWRAAFAGAAFLTLITSGVSEAAPFYTAWGQLYDHTANVSQFPHAMALDSRGNVFVTGHQIVGSGKGMYTAKYDALDGHLVWERAINPSGTNEFIANDIAVDSQGDCVITGSRNLAGTIDYYTIKLKGEDGTNFWAVGPKTFNGANDAEDTALKVVCDHADNIIVTGRSVGKNVNNNTGFDFVTIKYDKDDGAQLFMDSYTQTQGNLDDIPAALAVDSSNNIYVGGMVRTTLSQLRFYLRKLSAADLTKLWDIVPISTGDEGGVTALAVDSLNGVVATGMFKDGSNHYGFFTIKFSSAGAEQWRTDSPPVSADTFGFPRPAPVGVAIDPDDNAIVTGTLLEANGDRVIRTVKYSSGGFFGNAVTVWPTPSVDTGYGAGDSGARAIVVDGAGNAIVVGESENEDHNTDLYVAKYDSQTGAKVFSTAFTGSFNSSADNGVDIATDKFGNISVLGDLVANKGTGIGLHEFATVKMNRFIAPTADALPNGITGVGDEAAVSQAGLPAISSAGVLATKLTFKDGKKVNQGLLVEGSAAGGAFVLAIKGQPAPVGIGEPAANWVSISDPIVAPNGAFAFAGKVSGTGSKANGVWANLDINNPLKLVLRQGSVPPVVGLTDKLTTVMALGMANNSLIALVKLSGPGSTNLAVIRIDQNNVGTLLLRTGQAGLMINGEDYTVKSITMFSPPKLEAGDGRWQGSTGVVVRVKAVKTSDPKVKANAIVSISNAGGKSAFAFSGQAAPAPLAGATYTDFGLPGTGFGTVRSAFKATLTPRSKSANAAIIYTPEGVQFTAIAEKGAVTGVTGLPASAVYTDFTDPIVNTNSAVAFIGSLKGSPAEVKATSNKAIILRTATGVLTGTLRSIARTGDFAPDSSGAPSDLKWTSFTALALPGGSLAGPVFTGKLSAKKDNIGLWAVDSNGDVRQLLRNGDDLGGQIVKKFTLLTPVKTAMSAARSTDSAGSVAVLINFTDKTTAILRIGIP